MAFIFIYIVGSLSPMSSLLRYSFIRMAITKQQDGSVEVDTFEIDEMIKLWTSVECSTAAIAFCLPSLRGLLRRVVLKKREGRWNNTGRMVCGDGSMETVMMGRG